MAENKTDCVILGADGKIGFFASLLRCFYRISGAKKDFARITEFLKK